MTSRQLLTLVLVCLIQFNLSGQTHELVKSDSIVYPIHKNNLGKIVFMEKIIPIERDNADYLNSFQLKDSTDLNIRVFMRNSLTNYLHHLSPLLTAEELTNNGNYQFTFYVDNKKVYVENLTAGAGSADSKNRRTVFRVPLISTTIEDSWGRFLWNRFLMHGGEDAFTNGEHNLKIEIRPYLKQTEIVTGEIIAEGQIKIIVPEIQIDEKFVRVQQIQPLNDWPVSTDKYHSGKIEDLNRKIATGNFKDITSIIVIKNELLILEEYFNGANRNNLHDTRSIGKSFASAILGISIRDGYIKSENQTLNDFYDLKSFQNYSPDKDSITLKMLLTMTSPFDGSDMDPQSPGHEEKLYESENWIDFTLNLPLDTSKTALPRWDYFTAGVVILGDIINQSVPNGLEKYADVNLFQKLGISDYKWQYTPQKVANTAGGLQLRSLDYAKFGQLYKNNGIWNSQQILTQEWVKKSLSKQIHISDEDYYGYLFWNKIYINNNTDYEVYFSSGNGGNKIFIFKDQPVVVVITSTAFNTPYAHRQADKILQEYLIPAFIE